MVNLSGKKLFDYLNKLESELEDILSTSNCGSIGSLMHFQMKEIIAAEHNFLKYINSGGTEASLSISLNGLPSVASLNPDLEGMCKLSKEKKSFCEITKKFKKGMNGKNRGEEGDIYFLVSEDDWNEELKNRKKKVLSSDIGFSINRTDDGKFELALREDIYLQGYDKYSREFPVLIREGRMKYCVVWDQLIDEVEESFYVPNTALVLKGKLTEPSKKIFSDIKIFYKFGRFDYPGVDKPLFLSRGGNSIDYSKFLAAGTKTRVKTTEDILEVLKTALNRQVSIKGVRKDDLEQVLAFSMVPFKNAPEITPTRNELYNIEINNTTRLYLIFNPRGKNIGDIKYKLPHSEHSYGIFDRFDGYKLNMGGIILEVYGSAILDKKQDDKLKEGLKRVKKCELK